jgi:hypothetical protein
MAFPYTSDFVHSPKGNLEQRWAMAEPGPEAFVMGRIGLPKSFAGFEKLVEVSITSLHESKLMVAAEGASSVKRLVHNCV